MIGASVIASDLDVTAVMRTSGEDSYQCHVIVNTLEVLYPSSETISSLFGGNSNWRGPIWMPMNFLIIESLQRFHSYYGDDFKIECPTGSGRLVHLGEVADDLSRRLCRIFLRDATGRRPVLGSSRIEQEDP